ncbi:MAG: glutamine amidotransferase [Isosphaeraceae bacterium]
MIPGFSVSVSPIVPWPLLIAVILSVTGLTLWAYRRRLQGSSGRWRWFALSLRLLAILLCLLAALRVSVAFPEKTKTLKSLAFLLDFSTSMNMSDEVGGKSRSAVGNETIEQARAVAKALEPDIDARFYRFDATLDEPKAEDFSAKAEPKGRSTALGSAMLEAQKRQEGTNRKLARMIVISDFASNSGINPLVAARQMKNKDIPVVTVGLGKENAGDGSRDINLREMYASPVMFVKNSTEIKGNLTARGFANQTLDVELFSEDRPDPVAKTRVKVPDGADVIPITGLQYKPQTPGDKMLTLKVAVHDGELVKSNNQISTFVTVLAGGLNVLFLQGSNWSWDYKYMMRSLNGSPDIQVEGILIRAPAKGQTGEVPDAEFAPGRYNVFVLSDLPADYLTTAQHRLLVEAVRKGAGLIMLGGHSSFGSGGWADTPLTDVLPSLIHPGDGQLEPEGGLKFVPNTKGLNSYILQVGASKTETARIWDAMKPILGTNRFGPVKEAADIIAETPGPNPEPLMLSMDVGKGRTIAYGGDTWVWYRSSEESRLAHRKFWRQIVFWLSHKENEGDNKVKLTLDRRRVAPGEKIDMTVTARDAKGASIPNVRYEAKVDREKADPPVSKSEEIYNQGEEGKGAIYAVDTIGEPGTYTVTVVAKRDGQELGRDTGRFLVYQDDRELENPSADLALARQIAAITEGEAITPERLTTYLKGLDRSAYSEYVSTSEHRVWDNWPFLLIFATLLTLEWWLRKRHGWV